MPNHRRNVITSLVAAAGASLLTVVGCQTPQDGPGAAPPDTLVASDPRGEPGVPAAPEQQHPPAADYADTQAAPYREPSPGLEPAAAGSTAPLKPSPPPVEANAAPAAPPPSSVTFAGEPPAREASPRGAVGSGPVPLVGGIRGSGSVPAGAAPAAQRLELASPAVVERSDPAAAIRVTDHLSQVAGKTAMPVDRDSALDLVAASAAPRFAVRFAGQRVQVLDRAAAFRARAAAPDGRLSIVELWDEIGGPVGATEVTPGAIAVPAWLIRWEEEAARREAEARSRESALSVVRTHRRGLQQGMWRWLDHNRLAVPPGAAPPSSITLPVAPPPPAAAPAPPGPELAAPTP